MIRDSRTFADVQASEILQSENNFRTRRSLEFAFPNIQLHRESSSIRGVAVGINDSMSTTDLSICMYWVQGMGTGYGYRV